MEIYVVFDAPTKGIDRIIHGVPLPLLLTRKMKRCKTNVIGTENIVNAVLKQMT
jgi:hypothetical protein